MLGVTDPLTLAGLLVFSLAVTLLADRAAAGFGRPSWPTRFSAARSFRLAMDLFWILLLFSACIIAARYVERLSQPLLGWLLFGGLAFLTSLVRARLFL